MANACQTVTLFGFYEGFESEPRIISISISSSSHPRLPCDPCPTQIRKTLTSITL